MYVKNYISLKIPDSDKPVGYDFEKGDWVKPWGAGEVSDVEFFYTEDRINPAGDTYKLHLMMRFPEEHNGANLKKKDMVSAFKTDYAVSDNIFQQQYDFKIEREKGMYSQRDKFGDAEYLAFRVRSKTNEVGKIISAYYGKMDRLEYAIGKEGKIRLRYYLNPNENDRNIEFATGQNLFGRREFNSEP